MKRLLAILISLAMALSLLPMTLNAITADIVIQAGSGTAVIDGIKDEAYDTATPLDFVQKGKTNGGGEVLDEPIGHAWVINDDTNVYVFFSVIDSELDSTSANNYETDSVDVFWMNNNEKQQWRLYYENPGSADSGVDPAGYYSVVVNDEGYDVECYFPITDVLDNSIEMCLQINACSGGKRDYTCYILDNEEADDAYQRSTRQSEYDVWWTLALTGEHETNRVDPEPVAEEITIKNYASIQSRAISTSFFIQDNVAWQLWHTVGNGESIPLGETVEQTITASPLGMTTNEAGEEVGEINATNTNDWTVLPKFNLQMIDSAMVEGDKGEYNVTVSNITVSAEGYEDAVFTGEELGYVDKDYKLECSMADWGSLTGNAREIALSELIVNKLGITNEEYCTKYLTALKSITYSITYNSYNHNTKEVVDAFVEGLVALEQSFIDNDLKEYTDRVNAALESANGANGDLEVLNDALDEATKATNRARTECNNSGYTNAALTYVEETLVGVVDQIQAMVDEAVAAQPAEPEVTDAPEDEPADDSAPSSSNTESSGSNTGLVVGIIVVVVIVVVAVVAILLGKKKKN